MLPQELDFLIDNITDAITEAYDQTLPHKLQYTTRKKPIWWTKELTEIKRTTLSAKRKLQNASYYTRSDKLTTFIEQKQTYKQAIAEAKLKSKKFNKLP